MVKVNLKAERSKCERKAKKKAGQEEIEQVFKVPGGKTLPGGNRRSQSHLAWGWVGVGWGWWWANPCNFDSNLVLALRTWAQ